MTAIVAPFAAVQAKLNAAVLRQLADAVATVSIPAAAAGMEIAVMFDNDYLFANVGSGIETAAPAATVNSPDLPSAVADALQQGAPVVLVINAVAYTVVEPMPDGTGVTVLRLRT